ncbi:MAG: hypothetical protein M1343_12840 [Chloroflexi bacterium]|nr:hypothetical protein [Chloroflexota bacterium]
MNSLFTLTPFQVSFLLIVSAYSVIFRGLFSDKRLLTSWLAGAAGFLLGQFVAERFSVDGPIMLGNVHLIETSVAAWGAMLLAQRLRL